MLLFHYSSIGFITAMKTWSIFGVLLVCLQLSICKPVLNRRYKLIDDKKINDLSYILIQIIR